MNETYGRIAEVMLEAKKLEPFNPYKREERGSDWGKDPWISIPPTKSNPTTAKPKPKPKRGSIVKRLFRILKSKIKSKNENSTYPTYSRLAELMFEATLVEGKKYPGADSDLSRFPVHPRKIAQAIEQGWKKKATKKKAKKKKAKKKTAKRVRKGRDPTGIDDSGSKRTQGGEAPTGEDYSVGI